MVRIGGFSRKYCVFNRRIDILCRTYFDFKYHLSDGLEYPYFIIGAMIKDMEHMHGQNINE